VLPSPNTAGNIRLSDAFDQPPMALGILFAMVSFFRDPKLSLWPKRRRTLSPHSLLE